MAGRHADIRVPDSLSQACEDQPILQGLGASIQNDNLATCPMLFHTAMGLHNLIELKDRANLHGKLPRGNFLHKILERRAHEVFVPSIVSCQTNSCWYLIHRAEVLKGPLVTDHPGHTHDAALLRTAERI